MFAQYTFQINGEAEIVSRDFAGWMVEQAFGPASDEANEFYGQPTTDKTLDFGANGQLQIALLEVAE